jgi:3-dehydroquinate synthase
VKKINVATGSSRYHALVGRGLLGRIGAEVAAVLPPSRCAVVADEKTAPLFAESVARSLRGAGFDPAIIEVPSGERAKSLEEVARVCDEMAAAKLDRACFVVALGGGVIGDLAGFAAAIYHRGIPHVQVPTTLLAQVDSSIGGKTAVNTRAGKNLLGAVHQPALVLADVETLRSLPPREFNQGFAEIIKHAIIAEPWIFQLLEQVDRSDLTELVARNIEVKAAVVAEDERDASGRRAVLNFGHTVGHAIERAAGYGVMLHGEAVSLGIVAACEISVRKAAFPEAQRDQVLASLHAFDLPTRLPVDFPRDQIMPALAADKKFERGEVRFVLTSGFGSARLTNEVTVDDIRAAIAQL